MASPPQPPISGKSDLAGVCCAVSRGCRLARAAEGDEEEKEVRGRKAEFTGTGSCSGRSRCAGQGLSSWSSRSSRVFSDFWVAQFQGGRFRFWG